MNPRYLKDLERVRRIVELTKGRPNGEDPTFSVEGSVFGSLLEIIEAQNKKIRDLDLELARLVTFIPQEELTTALPWLKEHQEYQEGADNEA